jgi:hypothetical protein
MKIIYSFSQAARLVVILTVKLQLSLTYLYKHAFWYQCHQSFFKLNSNSKFLYLLLVYFPLPSLLFICIHVASFLSDSRKTLHL